MTYLELCNRVREVSGISGAPLVSVNNATGIHAKIAGWVSEAALDVERFKPGWRFMWRRATVAAEAGTDSYSALVMGTEPIGRLYQVRNDYGYPVSIVEHEQFIPANDGGPLRYVALSPAGDLQLSPTPSANSVLHVVYYRKPARLVNDADTPSVPSEHHDCIVQRALMYYGEFEEDQFLLASATLRYEEKLDQLCRDQLPAMA